MLIYFTPGTPGSTPTTGFTVIGTPGPSSLPCTESPCLVTGLTNGQSYTFTMTATNIAGTSEPSQPSRPVTPNQPSVGATLRLTLLRTAPSAPLGVSAPAGGNAEYTVSVFNEDPDNVDNLTITVPRTIGLNTVLWTCTVTEAVCAPTNGSGAVTTTLNLGEYQVATVTLSGTLVPGTPYVEISAAANAPVGVTILGGANSRVFIDPIGPDPLFKSGLE